MLLQHLQAAAEVEIALRSAEAVGRHHRSLLSLLPLRRVVEEVVRLQSRWEWWGGGVCACACVCVVGGECRVTLCVNDRSQRARVWKRARTHQRPLGSSRDSLMAVGGVPRSPAKRPELVEAGLL